MKKQQPMPVVKWTRYGRWTEDGLYVVNNRNEVVYVHPRALDIYSRRRIGEFVHRV